ncbi:MAG: TrkA family potassium uptake protein [Pirellulaceae bacterium]
MNFQNLPRTLTTLVCLLIVVGSVGYVIIEEWSFMDAVFMTVITMSTVGYGETQTLTENGRIFTSVLITTSVVLMTCWMSAMTSALVSGEVSGNFRRKRDKKMIASFKDHVIVCGGGSMALTILHRLTAANQKVVCITNNPSEIATLRRMVPDALLVEDDPKSELAMGDANALAAKYLVAATEDDFDNLLITITGKGLGTNLQVISCAQRTDLASRMRKIGADQVICPLILSGEHVADIVAGDDSATQSGKSPIEHSFA